VLASGGGDWYLQGDDDPGWPDVVLDDLRTLRGGDFEAVDTLALRIAPDSGQALQPGPPDAPRNLAVAVGAGAATFTFTPPYAPPSAIGGYQVVCNPGALVGDGQAAPIVVGGLAAGVTYTCAATVSYTSGPGTPSNAVSFSLGVGDDSFPPGGVPSGWTEPGGSSAAWVVANDAANAGSLSLKAGLVAPGQTSAILYSELFKAGTVKFARKLSSAAGDDRLTFYVDGVAQATWTGDSAWSSFTFPLSAGRHALSWRFVKGQGTASSDGAWIDTVTLPAVAECRFRSTRGGCVTE
jgi:hypothetical protein